MCLSVCVHGKEVCRTRQLLIKLHNSRTGLQSLTFLGGPSLLMKAILNLTTKTKTDTFKILHTILGISRTF